MSLSNWDNEHSVIRKAQTMPQTTATVKVAATAAKDMTNVVLSNLSHREVVGVVVHLRNGSKIKVNLDG